MTTPRPASFITPSSDYADCFAEVELSFVQQPVGRLTRMR